LYISVDGQQWSQAYAESETRFFAKDDDTRAVFVKDPAGQVSLNLEILGLVLPTKKVR